MKALRKVYGSGPLHFVAVVVCFLISGYAILRLADSTKPVLLALWFLGALLLHDFLFYPVYTLLDRAAARGQGPHRHRSVVLDQLRARTRAPHRSGVPGVVPLILGVNAKTYRDASGLGTGRFFGRFLVFTAAVFLVPAALYCLRLLRWQRRAD